jgi:type IV pilus assembly protein PilQ
MTRAPLHLRTAGGLLALAALLAAAPARKTAEITAVRLQPAAGRAELVVDLRGTVEVSDFVLANPARLVVDLVGARLTAPVLQYDGVNRGPVHNVRYAQFRPDVVRVVVELDSARDYDVHQDSDAVRVGIQGGPPAADFGTWSSDGSRVRAPLAAAAAAAPTAASLPAAVPPRFGAVRTAEPAQQTRLINVTFDNVTISEVVATFAAFSGRSIVVGAGITGTVTAEIHDQPWDYAFNAILQGQNLAATELPGGIIRVDTRANLHTQDSLEPLVTRIVPINYAKALALAPSLAGIVSGRGKAIADTVTNSIVLTETGSRIAAVDSFIQSLDQRTPQVAIQARIVFVDRTELEDLGLQYDLGSSTQFFNQLVQRPNPATPGTNYTPGSTIVNLGGNAVAAIANASATLADGSPALNLVYSTVIGNFALTTFLQALQQVTLADLQAEPSVTVADNRPAVIFSGEDSPIRQVDVGAISAAGGSGPPRATTQFKRTGINLTVTPHVVMGTREVLMQLHAERSQVTPSAVSEIGAVFSTQEATTQLLVRDGETAVIGGLTVTEITVSKSGIPFLVDLPVIGSLFGFRSNRESRRDLLILVTPHIVDDLTTAGTGGTIR